MTDSALEVALRAAAGRVRAIRGDTSTVAGALAWESLMVFSNAWQSGAAAEHHILIGQSRDQVNEIVDTLDTLASALARGADLVHEAVEAERVAKARMEAAAREAAQGKITG